MKYVSKKNAINIYEFMEMCGLECQRKKKTRLSHNAMERKINKRYELFPDKIILPKRISYNSYNNESVIEGKVLEVRDDYGKTIAYNNPTRMREDQLMSYLKREASKTDLEKIRNNLLREQGCVVLKTGEIVSKEDLDFFELYSVNCKINRIKTFDNRGGRSLKRRKIVG